MAGRHSHVTVSRTPSSSSATPSSLSTYFFLQDISLPTRVEILCLEKSPPKNVDVAVFLPNPKFQPKGLCVHIDSSPSTGGTVDSPIKELIPLLFAPHLATMLLFFNTSGLASIKCSVFI